MQIKTFVKGPIDANNYLVIDEKTKDAILIDCSAPDELYIQEIKDCGVNLKYILLTHGHFDHIGGVAALVRAFEKRGQHPLVMIHSKDRDKISSYKNLAFSMGFSVEKFIPDIVLKGSETLKVAGYDVKVIHTPGHSKGGVCYLVKDRIFCGDTVFYSSYGRYDFYDGDFKELKNSIVNRLFTLEGEYEMYPGHGDVTKLSFEKKHNMILHDDEHQSLID